MDGDTADIATVRRFSRTVTQRVGALDDHFLARDRPLGAARVLWELGPDGCDVRALRTRLGLDSGYCSRLLRTLEADGLVVVAPDPADRRRRLARPTAAGLAERALLDERSDAAAWSLLAPLDPPQRARLVDAMGTVERLLTAGLVEVRPTDPRDPDARRCIAAYVAELDRRFPGGFDPGRSLPADDEQLTPPAGVLLVAHLAGRPVGCGALKLHGDAPAEVKRMWVDPAVRGLGLGRRLLHELEQEAVARGADAVQLETNATLVEAVALYRSAGYVEVPPDTAEPYADHWFRKRLAAHPAG